MFIATFVSWGGQSTSWVTCKSMEEISGTDNWNALIGFNSTQMLITGNNEICLSLSGTGQHVIIDCHGPSTKEKPSIPSARTYRSPTPGAHAARCPRDRLPRWHLIPSQHEQKLLRNHLQEERNVGRETLHVAESKAQ
jgi:hypothetical protein